VEKTPFLNDKQFPFLIQNHKIIRSNNEECRHIRAVCSEKKITKQIEKIKEWKSEIQKRKSDYTSSSSLLSEFRWSPFLDFSTSLSAQKEYANKPFDERVKLIGETWKALSDEDKKIFKKQCPAKNRLPISSQYNPDRYLGVISEKLEETLESYLKKNEKYLVDMSRNDFKELIYLKSMKSCITPGDSVGILAAQSIGN
jgi:hypothetical protein